MMRAFEFVAKSGVSGPFLEFGCYEGASFIRAYKAFQYWSDQAAQKGWDFPQDKLFAFDSFQGLPELTERDRLDGYGVFEKAQYACPKERFEEKLRDAQVNLNDVTIVAGFYSQTLTEKLKAELSLERASVIHVDCDLYSSARDVFHFIESTVQDGTLLLLDDYFCYRGNPKYGVQRAFIEWCENAPVVATPYIDYSWAGKSFILSILEASQNAGGI